MQPKNTSDLPHWDMTPFFPGLDSPEFEAAFQSLIGEIGELTRLFDVEGIATLSASPLIDEVLVDRFERVTHAFNATLDHIRTVRSYISSFVATDSRNEFAQAKASKLRREAVALSLASTRYTAWLGSLDVEGLVARSQVAKDHAFYIREAKIASQHLLSPVEEELAADLFLSGTSAWSRLYSDYTSQILVPFARTEGGPVEDLPISIIRSLASEPNRELRRRAFEEELTVWKRSALPLAAALNSIKHEATVFARRRKWGTPLDAALFNNHIDHPTLEAMLSAARKSFPDFRRYLRAKAKHIAKTEQLAWFDLFAPVGTRRPWSWKAAEEFIAEQFGTYSPKMRTFAERAFRENWIDAEPRPGKRDGAFCMGVREGESRILQNYRPAFSAVSTLAHELGHGYHNLCMVGKTPLQRGYPMTLAETASIFCETIIRHAALKVATPEEEIAILEGALQGQCQVVVDITSRFIFEQRVIDRRQERELSVDELCALMRGAQLETYGDGLDESTLHPYMWAAKSHYYGSSFYNYPYMFGLLFGQGLYARYQQDPDNFRADYDELLALTGMENAADLAARFGIDIRTEDFWAASLDLIRKDIDRFEQLAAS